MRKKPPDGLPTINSGQPWSADDLADIEEMLMQGRPVAEIAAYLCREIVEVECKIASMRH
jgi:hypothetical protein